MNRVRLEKMFQLELTLPEPAMLDLFGSTWMIRLLSERTLLIQAPENTLTPIDAIHHYSSLLQSTLYEANAPKVTVTGKRTARLIEIVPAYHSIALMFDETLTGVTSIVLPSSQHADCPPCNASPKHTSSMPRTPSSPRTSPSSRTPSSPRNLTSTRTLTRIPVCYSMGLDWADVEKKTGLSRQEIIRRHTAPRYVLAMMGFAPGFLFLDGLDKAISCPRKDTPRASIPEGSVGIAGHQTGLYSLKSPGGWQIIGRTPHTFFDPRCDPPSSVEPGDPVEFYEITEDEFHRMKEKDIGAGDAGDTQSELSSATQKSHQSSVKKPKKPKQQKNQQHQERILIEVIDGGFLTTLQDDGRFGLRKYGVPISGVMDPRAHRLSNWLIGNAPDAPVFEMTLIGGTYLFHTDANIAVTGAQVEVRVDGIRVDGIRVNGVRVDGIKVDASSSTPYRGVYALKISAGSTLSVGSVMANTALSTSDADIDPHYAPGCRIYMAIRGCPDTNHPDTGCKGSGHRGTDHKGADHPDTDHPGTNHSGMHHPDMHHPDIEMIMGSFSTCIAAGFGGFRGRPLKKGDKIRWIDVHAHRNTRINNIPKELLPSFHSQRTIRIIAGPEWHTLPDDTKTAFLQQEYRVSSRSNRMGIRLKNRPLCIEVDQNFTSSPVVPGIIQVPPDGQPIILMNDAQSIGGYPRIAKVIDEDLWLLGQAWTKHTICFELREF